MMRYLIGILATLLTLAAIALVVVNRGTYTSLLPSAVEEPVLELPEAPEVVESPDTLATPEIPTDSLIHE